jgi:hypothetical protein
MRESFERGAKRVHLVDVLSAEDRDDPSTVDRVADDEPVLLELSEGLAHRRPADAKLCRQLALHHRRTGWVLASEDGSVEREGRPL